MPISPTYFRSRLDTNGARMKALNSEKVIYRRKANQVPDLDFTFILADEAEEFIPAVAITRVERQDMVCDTVDLETAGFGRPLPGDEVIRSDGTVFRVVSMAGNNPPYTFTTSTRKRIRIHAEQIA